MITFVSIFGFPLLVPFLPEQPPRVEIRALVPRHLHTQYAVPPPAMDHPVPLLQEQFLRLQLLESLQCLLHLLHILSPLRGKSYVPWFLTELLYLVCYSLLFLAYNA